MSVRKTKRHVDYGWLFLLVSVCGFVFFYLFPLFFGGVNCFIDGKIISFSKGINVYAQILQSKSFMLALKNTILFMVCCIPTLLMMGVGLAFCVECGMTMGKRMGYWIAMSLLPYIIPSTIIAQIIKGVVGDYVLQNSAWTFVLLCMVFLWKNTGYTMVILLSGSTNISNEQREAAALEGAGRGKIYRSIVLPQLIAFIRFSAVMGIVGIFKLYRESYLLFGNYPNDKIYMLQNFLNNNFKSWNYDRAVAASMILFLIMAILWLTIFRERNQEEVCYGKG